MQGVGGLGVRLMDDPDDSVRSSSGGDCGWALLWYGARPRGAVESDMVLNKAFGGSTSFSKEMLRPRELRAFMVG